MQKILQWMIAVSLSVIAVALVVGLVLLIPMVSSIHEDSRESREMVETMMAPEGFEKLIGPYLDEQFNETTESFMDNAADAFMKKAAKDLNMTPENMATLWAITGISAASSTTAEDSAGPLAGRSVVAEDDLNDRKDRSFRKPVESSEVAVSKPAQVWQPESPIVGGREEVNVSLAPPSENTTEMNATSEVPVNVSQAQTAEPIPPSNEAPAEPSQECPAGTPSWNIPAGGPPDEITGECEGVSYHCYRENAAPTPSDPGYYYRCSTNSELGDRDPPDQMGGSYSGIEYNCVLQPDEPTADYPYYRYRCTLS